MVRSLRSLTFDNIVITGGNIRQREPLTELSPLPARTRTTRGTATG